VLWTVAVILFILWLPGVLTKFTMGGLIYILLILAIVAVAVNLVRGSRHS